MSPHMRCSTGYHYLHAVFVPAVIIKTEVSTGKENTTGTVNDYVTIRKEWVVRIRLNLDLSVTDYAMHKNNRIVY
jgi:hypothetical protein